MNKKFRSHRKLVVCTHKLLRFVGEEVILKEQGKYKEYGDVHSMGQALRRGEIPAFALDSTMTHYHLQDLKIHVHPRIRRHHTSGNKIKFS